ncbi:MAG: MerR family transcriptional regulator, partial [Deltaproteobacteria bacterium]|nr:MerR family transcriptional regulator [Deltaproteobacteria bacterium]
MSQARYRIQIVAQRTQTPAATLRAWERRYGVPRPDRANSDYRLYTERDIDEINALKGLCERGLSPSEAAALIVSRRQLSGEAQGGEQGGEQEGAQGGAQGGAQEGAQGDGERPLAYTGAPSAPSAPAPALAAAPPARLTAAERFEPLHERILHAIRSFDVTALEQHTRHALLHGSAQEVFDEVFAPALRAVGEEWHSGALSIAQEHLATEVLGNATRDLLRAVQPPEGAPCALLACVQDEQHALPLYGSAFHFVGLGYRAILLGVNTPPEALIAPVRALAPAVVGLSVTQHNDALHALMPRYALACGDTPWLVGGAAAARVAGAVAAAGGRVVVPSSLGVRAALLEALGRDSSRG